MSVVTEERLWVGGDLVRITGVPRTAEYYNAYGIVQGRTMPQFDTVTVLVRRSDGSSTAPCVPWGALTAVSRDEWDRSATQAILSPRGRTRAVSRRTTSSSERRTR